MPLHVQPNRRARAACPAQSDDDPAPVIKSHEKTLVLADTPIEIRVREVIGLGDLAAVDRGANKNISLCNGHLFEIGNDLVRTVGVDILIIVACEESAAVDVPEIMLNRADTRYLPFTVLFRHTGNDIQPCNHSPKAIFLADVVGACTERFFPTNGHFLGVKKIAEELPAGGDFVDIQALLFSDEIDGARGGHATREAVDALITEIGNQFGVMCDDCQAITRRDEGVGAVNHISVTVPVRSRAKLDFVLVHGLDEGLRVDKVRVGVATIEVWGRDAILCAARGKAKFFFENSNAVGASDAGEGIEEGFEGRIGVEEGFDEGEVENGFQHCYVVRCGVDDLDFEGAIFFCADCGEVDIGEFGDLVGGE